MAHENDTQEICLTVITTQDQQLFHVLKTYVLGNSWASVCIHQTCTWIVAEHNKQHSMIVYNSNVHHKFTT